MGIILRYVLKNIKSNAKSSVLIFLLLTILSVITYNCLGIDKNVERKYQTILRSYCGDFDISVKYSNDSDKLEETIGLLTDNGIDCEAIEIDLAIKTFSFGLSDEADNQFIVLNADYSKAYNMNLFPKIDLEGNNVALTKSAFEELGLSIGDELHFMDETGNKNTFVLSESIENTRFFSSNGKTPFLIVSDDVWNQLNCYAVTEYIYIDVPDKMLNNSMNILSNNDLNPTKLVDEEMIKESSDSIRKMFWIILVFVFLICFFIVNAITNLIFYGRKEAIGTFRSIGATVSQTICIFLIENIIYGLVAGVIGGIIAILSENSVMAMFGFDSIADGDSISVASIFLKFLVTVTLTVVLHIVMSFSLIHKQCRRKIKAIIIEKKEKRYEPSLITFIVGVVMLVGVIALMNFGYELNFITNIILILLIACGITLSLPYLVKIFSVAVGQLFKHLNCHVLAISNTNIRFNSVIVNNIKVVCILSILMLTINIVSNSFASFFTAKADIYHCDYIISDLTSEIEANDFEDSLNNEKNIKWVKLFSNMIVVNVNDRKELNVTMVSDWQQKELLELFDGLKYDSEKTPELNDDEIIMDKTVCKDLELKIGDTIKLLINSENEREYKLVDMCSSEFWENNNCVFVVSHNEYTNLFGTIPSSIFIKADENNLADINKLIDSKKASIDTKITNVQEYKDKEYSENGEMLAIVNYVMLIATGLAIICIASNQVISFYQRKRELAVLYSTSMEIGQLMRMLFYETLLSAILSAFFAVIGVALTIQIVENLIALLGINIYMNWTLSNVIAGALAIGLLVIITSLLPIGKLKKFDVIKAIKYE